MVEIVVASALGKRTADVERSRELLAWVSRTMASRHLMKRSTGRLKEPIYRFALRDHREALEKIRELLVMMPAWGGPRAGTAGRRCDREPR